MNTHLMSPHWTIPPDDDDHGEAYQEELNELGWVKCKCGHECHYTEASEGYVLCVNCLNDSEEAKI